MAVVAATIRHDNRCLLRSLAEAYHHCCSGCMERVFGSGTSSYNRVNRNERSCDFSSVPLPLVGPKIPVINLLYGYYFIAASCGLRGYCTPLVKLSQ